MFFRLRRPAEKVQHRWTVAILVARCSWLYAVAVLGLCALLGLVADRWWPGTLVLFGPRWVWALPLAILIPTAAAVRPRLLWLLLFSLVLVIGPVMGLCIPWQASLGQEPKFTGVRVLTCNTDGRSLDPEVLAAFIAETNPDIVAMQEWSHHKTSEVFGESGWFVRIDNQLCIGSRYPIRNVAILSSNERYGTECGIRYDLVTPGGVLYFYNFHLATVRQGLEEVIASPWRGLPALRANTELRWRESELARRWVDEVAGPVLLAGDFNMPCESAIYRQYWSPFSDAFSSVGLGWGNTKFTRWYGVRIDHILAGPGWRFRRCSVGPDVKSDHRPVIAEAEWRGAD